MKSVCVLVASVVLLSACVVAQSSAPESGVNAVYLRKPSPAGPATAPPDVFFRRQIGDKKVSAGFVAIVEDTKPVTGAPYTAKATTETTQVLADGNRIVHKTTAFLARDSQGRTRREESMGGIGPLAVSAPKIAFITDPVSKTNYILDMDEHSAHPIKTDNYLAGKPAVKSGAVINRRPMVTIEEKITSPGLADAGAEQKVVIMNAGNESGQVKTESLGAQMIEGVSAEGKRVTRTIPAGQIGNERPLEITSEVWTSPELQVMVLSKRNDPRLGETVYRLSDIKQGEPDPSLFEVPSGFSIK
jgi:hypothetical protein